MPTLRVLLALIATCPATSLHGAEPKKQPSVADEAARHCEAGQYLKALDLLEPVRAKGPIEWGFQAGSGNVEEFMVRMYERSNAAERGVTYFNELFRHPSQKPPTDDPETARSDRVARMNVDDALLDLSLQHGDYDLAQQAYESKKAHESWPGLDLDLARIQAARGSRDEALETLRRYLHYQYGDSRPRLIATREFKGLHGDAGFQELMTESKEDYDARLRERFRSHDTPKQSCTVEGVARALVIYRKVPGASADDRLRKELEAADKELSCDIEPIQRDLLALLQGEPPNGLGRLVLATRLAGLKTGEVPSQAVSAVSGDDFKAFPSHLFSLAYAVARSDPERARPFLMQMLSASAGGGVVLPQHAMTVDEYGLLIQAFGVAETRYVDDLLRVATTGGPTESQRATVVLAALQEPRAVPLLERRALEEERLEDRRLLIQVLASMCAPEASAAMKSVERKLDSRKDPDAKEVARLEARMTPEEEPRCYFMEPDGISITDPRMKQIFLNDLENMHGSDVSFVRKTLRLSVASEDIPKLRRIRESVLHRFSDEAQYDHHALSAIICELQRKGGAASGTAPETRMTER